MTITKYFFLTTILAFFISSCGSVPITGRRQLLLVSNQEVLALSNQQYNQFKQEATLSRNMQQQALVTRVGQRIAQAVTSYMKQAGLEKELDGYHWEFNLVESDAVNAFCMPGGKIVIYTGILPITQDETGLAVVMGHEVAHAIAKHSNERISQQLVTNLGNTTLSAVLASKGASATTQVLANTLYGIGTHVGNTLPHSRKQELEADKLGLVFMAMAGYDPRAATPFWQRMATNKSGSVAEFLSTHPSDQTRIKEINKHLPEALKYYQTYKKMPTHF